MKFRFQTIKNVDHKVIAKYVQLLRNNPFLTQENIAAKLNISKKKLISLNHIIRLDDDLQNYIRNEGCTRKYWQNTITPLLKSKKLQSSINNTYSYPYEISLYPGISCMFHCDFCGRNHNIKYNNKVSKQSLFFFKKLFNESSIVADTTTFRISGGVEPLTNIYTGDIITYGKNKGFNVQLYTNGFLLTKKYLEQHVGILDASSIRISIYGIDDESTFAITKNKQAYNVVTKNIINLLNNSNLPKSTKIGLNYVILSSKITNLYAFINYIRNINKQCIHHLDFITIREDFTQSSPIIGNERNKLYNILKEIKHIIKNDTFLRNIYFDFGYALDTHDDNNYLNNLITIPTEEMIPEGFPQVWTSVDVNGDVCLYHGGFIERKNASRYNIGNIKSQSLESILKNWINNNNIIIPKPNDIQFLDASDHIISKLINTFRDNIAYGIPIDKGPYNEDY